MRPLYIFDLDGTIANIDHRRPLLDNKEDSHRWERFFEACDKDEPNKDVISTMFSLSKEANLFIWSGRSESVREKTISWLFNLNIALGVKMRPEGDYTPDEQLKERWLNEMSKEDRERLVAVFDDRQKVVDMWRRNGVTCFQVAKGDF